MSNQSLSLNPSPTHLGWVDLLRIVACFLVVLAHCCDPFVAKFTDNYTEFLHGAFIGSLVRPCVPLFVMISGVLLLPTNMDMGEFYKKRLKRIVLPLIIWSLITPFFYYFYLGNFQTLNPNIAAPDVMPGHTLMGTLEKLYTFAFNFNYDTIPLWYLYMLVGLYLFMPIISSWVSVAKKKEVQIFLGIWLFSMLVPFIKMFAPYIGYEGNYGSMGILGECPWNPYGSLYYFSGFLGYVVLAHYLVKYPFQWGWGKTLAVAATTFIVGYAITSLGFINAMKDFVSPSGEPDWENIEVLWYFFGINVFLMTFAVFIVFQKISFKASPLVKKIANLTFGVYLCHFFFVQVCYDLIYGVIDAPPAILILLTGVSAFIIALFVSWLLSLTGFTRKAIM